MFEIRINEEVCTGCGDCIKVCVPEVLYKNDNMAKINGEMTGECLGCQSCVVVCPEGAITILE